MGNLRKFLLILGFAAAAASVQGAQPGEADDPSVRDRVFLVVFEPGPAWIDGKPLAEQPLREHGRYVLKRYAEGRIQDAGPFTDEGAPALANGAAGALIYRADSLADVEALLAEDPAVADGVMVPTVYPWLLREWDHFLRDTPLRAHGTFVPRRTALDEPDGRDGVALERQLLEKRYQGDLTGEGRGEMLTAITAVEGSMAYVAIERVTGELAGRSGSFVLQHSASLDRGAGGWLTMTVVPDSGTGGLAGLTGEMRIDNTGGEYRYELEYSLPR